MIPQAIATAPTRSMNRLESSYAQQLDLQQRVGEIRWYEFEPIKIRLADKTYYTPDFLVVTKDHRLEFHECKGHWEDDARVKIKVAAEHFPAKFIAIKKTRNGWEREEF